MARKTDIRFRRSATQGSIPTTSQLNLGEIALNTYDGKLYMKKSVGGSESVVEIGAGGGGISSTFTAYEFTATSNQTTFSGSDNYSNTLAYNTGTPPKVQVYMNGILLDEGSSADYTGTNGTSIILTTAATAGDLIQIHAYKSDVSVVSNLSLTDNQKIQFGDDQDLQIYHNGTNQDRIDSSSTYLILEAHNHIFRKPGGSEDYAKFFGDGSVELYHNNAKKFETTASGVQIQGNVAATTAGYLPIVYGGSSGLQLKSNTSELFANFVNNGAASLYHDNAVKLATDAQGINVTGGIDVADITATGNISLNSDNGTLYFGAGADMRLYHDGLNSYIDDSGTGSLKIRASQFQVLKYGTAEQMIQATEDGAVTLYHDNSSKLSTTSLGIDVTGEVQADSLDIDGLSVLTSNNNATPLTLERANATSNQVGIQFSAGGSRYFGKGTDHEPYWATSANLTAGSKIITMGNASGLHPTFSNISVLNNVIHDGDADTKISFSDDTISLTAGNQTSTFSGNGNVSMPGDLSITGNLTVSGTTTIVNSANLNVQDKNITLNYSSSDSSSTADGAGITIQDAVDASNDATLNWNATDDNFEISHGLDLPDDSKLRFGANHDLQIYHDPNNSFILHNNTSGYFKIGAGTSSLFLHGNRVDLRSETGNETMLQAFHNGAVKLYHDAALKLETNASGIDVTGSVVSDSLSVGSDTDTISTLGRAKIGAFVSDYAYFSHIDNATSTNYALNQNSTGATSVNAKAGTNLGLKINNSNVLTVFANSRVGIGVSSADAPLHVEDTTASAYGGLKVVGAGTGSGSTNVRQIADFGRTNSGSVSGVWLGGRTDETTAVIGAKTASGNIAFEVYNSGWQERMRITNAGAVGIGTDTPSGGLHVANSFIRVDNSEGIAAKKVRASYFSTGQNLTLVSGTSASIVMETPSVGINTGATAPARRLEVNHHGSTIGLRLTRGDNAGNSLMEFANTGGVKNIIGHDSGRAGFVIGPSTTPSVTIKNATGNVGIGTDNPGTKLHVAGTGDPTIKIQDLDGTNQYINIAHNGGDTTFVSRNNTAHGSYSFYTHDGTTLSERFTINANGYVGVNKTNPIRNFEVGGDIGVGDGNKVYLWNGHNSNYIKYDNWQGSASAGMTIANIAGTGDIILKSGNKETIRLESDGRIVTKGHTTAYNNGYTRNISIQNIVDSSNNGFGVWNAFIGTNLKWDDTNNTYVRASDQGNANWGNIAAMFFNGASNSTDAAIDWVVDIPNNSVSDASEVNVSGANLVAKSKMTLLNSGNLGLGTRTPSSLLHLSSGSYPKLNLTDTTGVARTFSVGTNNETFTIRNETAGSDAFTIDNANNAEFISFVDIPSRLRHSGDGDNYIGFSTDVQSFVTGNSTRLQISNSLVRFNQEGLNQDFQVFGANDDNLIFADASADKVGIGTNSPSSILTVDSGTATGAAYSPTSFNSASQIKIDVASAQNNYAGIQFTHSGNTEGFIGLIRPSTTAADADFVIQGYSSAAAGYTERMRLTDEGNVGIGTTTPSVRLHVYGGSDANLHLRSESQRSGAMIIKPGTNSIMGSVLVLADESYRLGTASNYHIQMNQNGQTILNESGNNVGIGDSTPDFKLAVRTPAIPSGSSYAWPLDLSRPNTDGRGLTFGIGPGGGNHVIAAHNGDVGIGHTYGVDSNNLPQYYETLSVKHTDQSSTAGKVGINQSAPLRTLEVGGAGANLRVGPDYYTLNGSTDRDYVEIQAHGSDSKIISPNERFHIENTSGHILLTTSGNVGINAGNAPAAKLHISGNSDNGDADCMLIIDDVDGSAGSRIPAIMFRSVTGGTTTNQGRIRGTGHEGMVLSGTSALGDDLVIGAAAAGRVSIGTTTQSADGLTIGTSNNNCEFDMTHTSGKRYRLNSASSGKFSIENKTDNYTNLVVINGQKIGINNSDPKSELSVNSAGIDCYAVNTSATSLAQIDTFDKTVFRSARFTIQITNTTDSTYQITELLLIHDGTTPSITQYGTIFTGSAREATIDADITGNNVRLLATPASADNMQFKVVRHSILV